MLGELEVEGEGVLAQLAQQALLGAGLVVGAPHLEPGGRGLTGGLGEDLHLGGASRGEERGQRRMFGSQRSGLGCKCSLHENTSNTIRMHP